MTSPPQAHARRTGTSVIAAGLLVVWVAFHLLVTFPSLHHVLHQDSGEIGHTCSLTQFASNNDGLSPTVSVRPAPLAEWVQPLTRNISERSGFLKREPHGPRPPPFQFATPTSTGSARV